jgi:hypothetical protein
MFTVLGKLFVLTALVDILLLFIIDLMLELLRALPLGIYFLGVCSVFLFLNLKMLFLIAL